MPTPFSRRQFLLAGAGGVAGIALLGACGSSGDDGSEEAEGIETPIGIDPKGVNVLVAAPQVLAGTDQRVTFNVLDGEEPLAADRQVSISIGTAAGQFGPPVVAERHALGVGDRYYWRITHRFEAPGDYVAKADIGGKAGQARVPVIDPAFTKMLIPGQAMRPAKTPTTADPAGVDPICTRNPICPWHEVSLDAALAEKKPLVAIFATPAFCSSSTCGPVLDNLLTASTPFADRVRFVHVEIYKDRTPSYEDRAPAVKEYNLDFEPIVYFAGADSVIRERLDGPYDTTEASAALARLTAVA